MTLDEIVKLLDAGKSIPLGQQKKVGSVLSDLVETSVFSDFAKMLDALPGTSEALDEVVTEVRSLAADLGQKLASERLEIDRVRAEILRALEVARQQQDRDATVAARSVAADLANAEQALARADAANAAQTELLSARLAQLEQEERTEPDDTIVQSQLEDVRRQLQSLRDDLAAQVETVKARIAKVFVSPPPSSIQVKKDGVKVGERRAINFSGATVTVTDNRDGVNVDISATGGGTMAAADILAALVTVDGSGSGLDADLLDGLSSAAFLKASGGDTLTVPDPATTGLVIKGAALQDANLTEWQDDSGNVVAYVGSNGGLVSTGGSYLYRGLVTRPNSASEIGVLIQGQTSQTEDLTQWQTIGGAVLAKVTSGGIANFAGVTIGGTSVLARSSHTGTQPMSTISDAGTLATKSAIVSADITDGTIVNGDINASAAIALSKLATDPLARANHTGSQTASTISDFDTQVATTAALKANNLSDLANAGTARTNLGLGTLATKSAIASADITDGTIVDADINASAAIALTKLATNPLARANHTGTQTASTISDFTTAAKSASTRYHAARAFR